MSQWLASQNASAIHRMSGKRKHHSKSTTFAGSWPWSIQNETQNKPMANAAIRCIQASRLTDNFKVDSSPTTVTVTV
jgi:hypothetical protein